MGLLQVAASSIKKDGDAADRARRWAAIRAQSERLLLLRAFDPDEPRDESGKWTDGGGSDGGAGDPGPSAFVSPNVGHLSFSQAATSLSGARQKMLAEASHDIDARLGKQRASVDNVIGAWADGAENSLMLRMPGWSTDAARVALAMKGYIGDQKSALLFSPDSHGDAFLASFPAKGSLGEIHKSLLDSGLQFHTLEPTSGGATVHVYGDDQATIDAIKQAAHGAEVQITSGRGEFIGTTKSDGTDREQRDDALDQYDAIISAAETSPEFSGRDLGETWDEIRDHWGGKLSQLEDLKSLRAFDPNEPRDPDGKWTDGGGSDGAGTAEADKPKPEDKPLNPTVINVGGDEWNKATARRLEREYQTAKPALDGLTEKATGQSIEAEPDKDDEGEPPFEPEEWDQLSDSDQEAAGEKYVEQNQSSYYDSEVSNWYDNGQALDEAKSLVANNFNDGKNTDWLDEAITKYREESDTRIPFTNEQLIDAINLSYQDGSDGAGDLGVGFEKKELQEPSNLTPGQGTLPGIEPLKPEDQLTQEMRDGLVTAINKAFDEQASDKQSSIEPPDYLADSAKEYLEEDWAHNLSDKDKFEWTKNNTSIVEEASTEGTQPSSETFHVDKLPGHFDPLNATSGADYKRTQALGRILSVERAAQVLEARKLPVPSKSELQRIDTRLWSGWKASSTNDAGKLLQVATADELGGRLNKITKVDLDADAMRKQADEHYADIGGYAGIKAYVRAKWETTQYLLDKAGIHDLTLYRGIRLDPDIYQKAFASRRRALQSATVVAGHKFLPALNVARNGAASTTVSPSIANGWGSSQNRVVLRAQVPRTAAISVPAYGINVHSEQEVVVAGTAWKGWDAWAEKAPELTSVPLQQAA